MVEDAESLLYCRNAVLLLLILKLATWCIIITEPGASATATRRKTKTPDVSAANKKVECFDMNPRIKAFWRFPHELRCKGADDGARIRAMMLEILYKVRSTPCLCHRCNFVLAFVLHIVYIYLSMCVSGEFSARIYCF